ncbi:MAG: glutathione S-transferase family protein [Proteobacteria bacterium]|nr:glutathione S-transferase family protein [Burkholderiales bacterium]
MIELYHAMHSTCSQKVRLCLAEKSLAFDSRLVAIDRKEHLTDWYLKLNPNGVVPTLVHDGAIVLDSSVICEYLDEQFPEVRLTPRPALERARMRTWMRYFEEVPTAAVRVPSFNGAFLSRFDGLDEERFRREQADIRPLRKHFYRRMGPKGFSTSDLEASVEQLSSAVHRMDAALVRGPWLLGETYSLADIVVAPLVDRMADLGLDDLWNDGKRPAFAAWFERLRARPAFGEAFPKGARLTEFLRVTSARELLAPGSS